MPETIGTGSSKVRLSNQPKVNLAVSKKNRKKAEPSFKLPDNARTIMPPDFKREMSFGFDKQGNLIDIARGGHGITDVSTGFHALHTHPLESIFSSQDIEVWINSPFSKTTTIIVPSGKRYTLIKPDNFLKKNPELDHDEFLNKLKALPRNTREEREEAERWKERNDPDRIVRQKYNNTVRRVMENYAFYLQQNSQQDAKFPQIRNASLSVLNPVWDDLIANIAKELNLEHSIFNPKGVKDETVDFTFQTNSPLQESDISKKSLKLFRESREEEFPFSVDPYLPLDRMEKLRDLRIDTIRSTIDLFNKGGSEITIDDTDFRIGKTDNAILITPVSKGSEIEPVSSKKDRLVFTPSGEVLIDPDIPRTRMKAIIVAGEVKRLLPTRLNK
jgi:hypothetical protein